MVRKIFAYLLVIAVLGLVGYLIWDFTKKEEVNISVFEAIPSNAAIIIEFKTSKTVHNLLASNEDVANITQSIPFWNKQLELFDSLSILFAQNPEAARVWDLIDPYVSVHPISQAKNGAMVLFVPPANKNKVIISTDIIDSILQINSEVKPLMYESAPLYACSFGAQKIYWTHFNGLYIMSIHRSLVQDAIRKINSPIGIVNKAEFQRIAGTAGSNVPLNIYMLPGNYNRILETLLGQEWAKPLELVSTVAGWTELDMVLEDEELFLTGYSALSDSENYLANLFIGQRPTEHKFSEVLPQSTIYFMRFGLSSPRSFGFNYIRYLDKNNLLFDHSNKLREIEDTFHVNFTDQFLPLLDDEIVTGLAYTGNNSVSYFASLSILDEENTIKKLGEIEQIINEDLFIKSGSHKYRDINIYNLQVDKLLSAMLGAAFNQVRASWCTVFGGHVLISNSKQEVEWYIDQYLAKNNIQKNKGYVTVSENTNSESNFDFYIDSDLAIAHLQNYLKGSAAQNMEEYRLLFKNLQGIMWQSTMDRNGLLYHNIYTRFQPQENSMKTLAWEVQLDTTLATGPWEVVNHNDGSKEIVVQDAHNTLYLIDAKGKVLWQKALNEKILGAVYQVDLYENNKLQLLFNTQNRIWVIDRNGQNVEKFPVKLSEKASAGMLYKSFDKGKRKRIYIPCLSGDILNYDLSGREVKGWNYVSMTNPISRDITYYDLAGKDYFMILDDSGSFVMVDRAGKLRGDLFSLEDPKGCNYSVSLNGSVDLMRISFPNADNNIATYKGKDLVRVLKPSEFDSITCFNAFTNRKGFFLTATDGNKAVLFSEHEDVIYLLEDKAIAVNGPFKVNNEDVLVFASDSKTEIIDVDGVVRYNSPYPAGTKSLIIPQKSGMGFLFILACKDSSLKAFPLK